MIEIEPFDPTAASDQVLAEVHRICLIAEAEHLPGDRPVSFERRLLDLRTPLPTTESVHHWLAREADTVAAVAWLKMWRDHDDIGLFWACVDPVHRRRGIAIALGKHAIEVLETNGRSRPIIDALEGVPWEGALGRHGFRKALVDTINRLHLADVDWDLMQRWVADAKERAADYHLLLLESPFPEEHLENWCRVLLSMNDAPREGLEVGASIMSPAKWRGIERSKHDRGDRFVGYAVVHQPTGVFAGMTDVVVQSVDRHHAQQDDTVVHPDHRNKGLGRLLKAAMIQHLAANYPDIEMIETENASSNDPMLKINTDMGFRPVLRRIAWQGDLDDIKPTLHRV